MKTEKVRISYMFVLRYDSVKGKREMLRDLKKRPGLSCSGYDVAFGSYRYTRIGKGRLEGDA